MMISVYHYFLFKTNYLYRALLLVVMLIPSYLFIIDNRGKIKKRILAIFKQRWILAFFYYFALILTATVFARRVQNPYQNIIGQFGIKKDVEWNIEIILNILMFVPLTFFYLEAFRPGKTWKSAIKLTIFTTFFIEFSQLLFWLGEFQISDIVYNLIGGLVGCGLWRIIRGQ